MDFTFGDESQSKILKLTKDCKEFPALTYVASSRSDDPTRYYLSFLYTYKLDGVNMLISSDGHRMNYAPFTADSDFTVIKQTRNELVLERIDTGNRPRPGFEKIFPRNKDVFQIRPYEIYGWGVSSWKLEFLIEYLYRLSNFEASFNFKYLTDFIDSLRADGKIRILCPRKGPGGAWRIEYTDNWGNLQYGTVFMPLMRFDELDGVKSPYVKNSGFVEYTEPEDAGESSNA
jgi:hypothetical protein